jgi:hypothetical protein
MWIRSGDFRADGLTGFAVAPAAGYGQVQIYNSASQCGLRIDQDNAGEAGLVVIGDGGTLIHCNNAANAVAFQVFDSGGLTIAGALSKGSGSFRIRHPLESKRETHDLVHSFIEGPQADLIYRGRVTLSDGSATVNIDTASGMTDGTFVLLCRDIQCFTSNETGWTAMKGSISGNILTITAQDNTCTDTISWLVVAERQDEHMKTTGTDWCDEDGHIIVEPERGTGEGAIDVQYVEPPFVEPVPSL